MDTWFTVTGEYLQLNIILNIHIVNFELYRKSFKLVLQGCVCGWIFVCVVGFFLGGGGGQIFFLHPSNNLLHYIFYRTEISTVLNRELLISGLGMKSLEHRHTVTERGQSDEALCTYCAASVSMLIYADFLHLYVSQVLFLLL